MYHIFTRQNPFPRLWWQPYWKMAANFVTGQICDGPIAKYHQKGIQCAKFHACIIKCTIQPNDLLSHICSTKQRHSASDVASSLFAGYSFRVMLPTRRLIVITCYINSSLERELLNLPLMRIWSTWLLVWPSSDAHVILWVPLCGNKVSPTIRTHPVYFHCRWWFQISKLLCLC